MLDLSLQQEGFSPGLAVNQESTAAVVVCGIENWFVRSASWYSPLARRVFGLVNDRTRRGSFQSCPGRSVSTLPMWILSRKW